MQDLRELTVYRQLLLGSGDWLFLVAVLILLACAIRLIFFGKPAAHWLIILIGTPLIFAAYVLTARQLIQTEQIDLHGRPAMEIHQINMLAFWTLIALSLYLLKCGIAFIAQKLSQRSGS